MPGLSLGLGLGFSRPVASAGGGGGQASWPFTGLGAEADWVFGGDAGWDAGIFFNENSADTAALTGAAVATFDAAVSNSTACSVTLTPSAGTPVSGAVDVAMKGGAPVTFTFDGTGTPVNHTVTSGAGSGFNMAGTGSTAGYLADIDIAPA